MISSFSLKSITSVVATVSLVVFTVASAQPTSLTSKERANKRDFDESLQIPCSQIQGEELTVCTAEISRDAVGDAKVVVTFPNDFSRTLYFSKGKLIRANATMSGVGNDSDQVVDNGIHAIRVDDQQFLIPNSFIVGK